MALPPYQLYEPFLAGQATADAAYATEYTTASLAPYSPGGLAAMAQLDDIRTIFVTGFPPEVHDRELHNLLRFLPGYEACQMNWKSGQPQGFALFGTIAAARAAVDAIAGLEYDDNIVLRCEMAHKNMYLKDDPTIKRASLRNTFQSPSGLGLGMGVGGFAGLSSLSSPYTPSPYSPTPMPGGAMLTGLQGLPSPLFAAATGGSGLLPAGIRFQGFSPISNTRDNPPCNTLFIGNLGDNVDENELRALFASQPGFRQLKLVRGPKNTTAFVEYVDVGCSAAVHQTLQGAVLATSERGGIRIQYSKNPFGKRTPSPLFGSEDTPLM